MPEYVANAPFGGSGWKVGSTIFSSESQAKAYEKSLSGGGGTTQATKTATQPATSSSLAGKTVPPSYGGGGSSGKASSGYSTPTTSKTSSVSSGSAAGSGGGYWIDTGESSGEHGYTIKYNPVTKEIDIPGLFTMPASKDLIERYESKFGIQSQAKIDALLKALESKMSQWERQTPPPTFQPPSFPTAPSAPPSPPETPKPPGVEGPPKVEGVPSITEALTHPEKLSEGVRRGQAGFESVAAPPVSAPSVDELVRTYREVFGPGTEEKYVRHYLAGPQFQRVLQGAVPMWMQTDPLWGQYLRRLGIAVERRLAGS